jgi:hypothetical protein
MPKKRGPYRMPRHPVTQPLDTDYRLIPLTQCQNAIVDAEDFEKLSRSNWAAIWSPVTNSFYAASHEIRNGIWTTVQMARRILNPSIEEQVDHKNHDTLDNKKINLRICSQTRNMQNSRRQKNNTSTFKGVHFAKSCNKWMAHIGVNGTRTYLGIFSSKKEAAHAYDEAAKIHHGEFACLNFPSQ